MEKREVLLDELRTVSAAIDDERSVLEAMSGHAFSAAVLLDELEKGIMRRSEILARLRSCGIRSYKEAVTAMIKMDALKGDDRIE